MNKLTSNKRFEIQLSILKAALIECKKAKTEMELIVKLYPNAKPNESNFKLGAECEELIEEIFNN